MAEEEAKDIPEDKEEESEEKVDNDLKEEIESLDSVEGLKEIADALEYPKNQWNARKTVESMKEYLLGKIAE